MDISKIDFGNDGQCNIYSHTGELISSFPTVYEVAFNRQYGTPLSKDGRLLFIGTWERGLYCYDTNDGSLMWKKRPGKVRRIIPVSDYLIVEMGDRGIYKRILENGDLIDEVKMAAVHGVFQISKKEIFTGSKRNHYFIYTIPDLIQTHVFQPSVLNPDNCLSFIISKCKRVDGSIIVSGFEEYPNREIQNKGVRNFERVLPAI